MGFSYGDFLWGYLMGIFNCTLSAQPSLAQPSPAQLLPKDQHTQRKLLIFNAQLRTGPPLLFLSASPKISTVIYAGVLFFLLHVNTCKGLRSPDISAPLRHFGPWSQLSICLLLPEVHYTDFSLGTAKSLVFFPTPLALGVVIGNPTTISFITPLCTRAPPPFMSDTHYLVAYWCNPDHGGLYRWRENSLPFFYIRN